MADVNSTWSINYYHNDEIGAPVVLSNQSGEVVWKAAKEAFGAAKESASVVKNNFMFPGQYRDEETGIYYNFTRNYDPSIGRYIQPDSIGLAGGRNTYVYVDNGPINKYDSYGLQAVRVPQPPPNFNYPENPYDPQNCFDDPHCSSAPPVFASYCVTCRCCPFDAPNIIPDQAPIPGSPDLPQPPPGPPPPCKRPGQCYDSNAIVGKPGDMSNPPGCRCIAHSFDIKIEDPKRPNVPREACAKIVNPKVKAACYLATLSSGS